MVSLLRKAAANGAGSGVGLVVEVVGLLAFLSFLSVKIHAYIIMAVEGHKYVSLTDLNT